MKDCRLKIRLSNKELELIKSLSSKFDLSVSEFILSILIPFCIKNQ